MSVDKTLGIVFAIAGPAFFIWCLLKNKQHLGLTFWFMVVLMIAGLIFCQSERITQFSMNKVGVFTAVFEKATRDAEIIENIREKVELQSAAIDSVAGIATEMQLRLASLDSAVNLARQSLEQLQLIKDYSLLVDAARNGSRRAYAKLVQMANDSTYELSLECKKACEKLEYEYGGAATMGGFLMKWPEDFDKANCTMVDIKKLYTSMQPRQRSDLLEKLVKQVNSPNISRKEKHEFLIEVIRNEEDLFTANFAIYSLVDMNRYKLEYFPLNFDFYLKWWEENKDKIE